MEAEILTQLVRWCSTRIADRSIMNERFSSILQLFESKRSFKIIKIAGTNGKGSTASMLSSCFVAEGKKVGLFTSPHLISVTERFRINDAQVQLNEVTQIAHEIQPILEEHAEIKGKKFIPSFFEVLILIAIEIFHRNHVEIAIFEAGVGGDNDSTSVLPSICSLLTSVGLDHKEQLGETLEEVALDKTGIANAGTTLIVNSEIPTHLKRVIEEKAFRKEVQVLESENYVEEYSTSLLETRALVNIGDHEMTLKPRLKGLFQKQNLNLIIRTWLHLQALGEVQHIDSIKGINHTQWEARFETLRKNPTWLLDAAHNPHALKALINALNEVSKKEDRVLLFGNSEEKDYQEIVKLTPEISENIYLVDSFYKAIPQDVLRNAMNIQNLRNIGDGDIQNTIDRIANEHPDKIVVVTGSIFMVGVVRKFLTSNP
jgi:dihydrofolate synthase/folylpolyglutamate synthase